MKVTIGRCIKRLGMPLIITDKLNLCFLIDTGASYNVLLRDSYEKHKDAFSLQGKNEYLMGMTGAPMKIFMVSGSICLDGTDYETEFGVLESTEAMNNVKILTGLTIDGAIGIDFLTRYGLVLDFATLELHD